MYCKALSDNKVKPMELLAKIYKKREGLLELSDLEREIKKCVESKDISFSELQHIMHAFDGNNDGKLTKDEYEVVVNKYDVTQRLPQGDDQIVKTAIQACKDKHTTLKECFSKCSSNKSGNITFMTFKKQIKE
jgi:Ca2+-binding EF-hand superfamily protein